MKKNAYRITSILKVETDIITSIAANFQYQSQFVDTNNVTLN